MTAQCIDVPTDEVDAFISEKMTDYAGNYVDMQRLFEICDNKPMIERERRAYRNTIDSLRDSLMLEQHCRCVLQDKGRAQVHRRDADVLDCRFQGQGAFQIREGVCGSVGACGRFLTAPPRLFT